MDPRSDVRRWTWLVVAIASCLGRTAVADDVWYRFTELEPGSSAFVSYDTQDPDSGRSMRREFEITAGAEAGWLTLTDRSVVGKPYAAGLDPFTAAGLDRTLRAYRMRRWTRTGSCKRRENVLISWRRQKVEHASEAFFDAYCGPSEPGSTGLLMLVTRLVDRDLPAPSVAPPPEPVTAHGPPDPSWTSFLLHVPVLEDWIASFSGLPLLRSNDGVGQLIGTFQVAFVGLGVFMLCVVGVPVLVGMLRGPRAGLAVALWASLVFVVSWQSRWPEGFFYLEIVLAGVSILLAIGMPRRTARD
jgi:hypothetical protein